MPPYDNVTLLVFPVQAKGMLVAWNLAYRHFGVLVQARNRSASFGVRTVSAELFLLVRPVLAVMVAVADQVSVYLLLSVVARKEAIQVPNRYRFWVFLITDWVAFVRTVVSMGLAKVVMAESRGVSSASLQLCCLYLCAAGGGAFKL